MDLTSLKRLNTIGRKKPSGDAGEFFIWDPLQKRDPLCNGMDYCGTIASLRKENKTLRCSLARKYQHCNRLKQEVEELTKLIKVRDDDSLTSQSGVAAVTNSEPGLTMSETSPMATNQITAFADQDAGWTTNVHGEYDATRDTVEANNSSLGQFLARPIRQSVQSWVVTQPLFYQFNPWKEFIENSFVFDKISNYELLRMKLHCKIVISGTKFHYGRALAYYNPFIGYDQVTKNRAFIEQDLISASQKPHCFLNPTKNTGGEICMPFFWNKNYISLVDRDYLNMGDITLKSFGNLLHANGGDDPVTITIYLWAEDVVLTMPTSKIPLISQAGRNGNSKLSDNNRANSITANDEYGSGIISKPAAVVAKAAGLLSNIPAIKPFALATQMVSGTVGEIAKIFGYSRPAIISDIQLFKPNPTGNLTNVDAPDAVHKLTMDSKAEITIDSRVAGLDGVDQMGILDIAQRESFLTSFTWSPSDGVDTLLWNCRVTPMLYAILFGNQEIHPTPMSMLAQCFDVWQGSIRFRFQVVKSDFHKGRILARFDPRDHEVAVEYNVNYSRVIDIAEEDDFEIVVGWAQAKAWLNCGSLSDSGTNYSVGRISGAPDACNGVLELDVLNALVCPAEDSPISINVFVSMCEDAKFAAPSNRKLNNYHLFPEQVPVLDSQSGLLDGTENPSNPMTDRPTGSSTLQPIASCNSESDQTYSVFYGDPPTTIRELCKRYVQTKVWVPSSPGDGVVRIVNLLNKDAPYQSGWDPEGIDTSEVDGTTKLNVVNTDYSSWWAPCYAGVRGARRKKYFFNNGAESNPSVTRGRYAGTGNGVYTNSSLLTTADTNKLGKWASTRTAPNSGGGSSATNLGVNNTIEVELPFYAEERFRGSRMVRAQSLPSNSHSVVTTSMTANSTTPALGDITFHTTYQQWDAVGEDYTLMFFTGCPVLYNYTVREFS